MYEIPILWIQEVELVHGIVARSKVNSPASLLTNNGDTENGGIQNQEL